MSTQIESAARVFEEIEKIRRGLDTKLTHLEKNRRCLGCGRDFMPKKFEPCPECGSKDTRMMKARRKCLECDHRWEPGEIGQCPWCEHTESVESPRDDPYIREIALPRLRAEEEFYEAQLTVMVSAHPAWQWAENVKGAGLTTVGRIIGKTDIFRLETPSEMWAHCGWGLYGDGTIQRKRKGELLDYDAQLQSVCVILGESLLRAKDSYYQFYLGQKAIHAGLKPRHCHNRAFRHMIKLFLAHFWQNWREEEGLPAPVPYVFAILKHTEGHQILSGQMVKQPAQVR